MIYLIIILVILLGVSAFYNVKLYRAVKAQQKWIQNLPEKATKLAAISAAVGFLVGLKFNSHVNNTD